jgi:hypothetical protein
MLMLDIVAQHVFVAGRELCASFTYLIYVAM